MVAKLAATSDLATIKIALPKFVMLCKNKPAHAKVLDGLTKLAATLSKIGAKPGATVPPDFIEAYNKLADLYNTVDEAEQAAKPKEEAIVYKLGGVEVDDADDLIKKIKGKTEVLSAMEGNVAQCVNGLLKEKGSGHVSHGVKDTDKACTLFFKKDGNVIDVVDIARHITEKNAVRYVVVWGKRKGKTVGPGAPT